MASKIDPEELKHLVRKHGLDGAVLLAVDDAHYQLVSWGRDKKQCSRFRRVVEDLGELIDKEHLYLE